MEARPGRCAPNWGCKSATPEMMEEKQLESFRFLAWEEVSGKT